MSITITISGTAVLVDPGSLSIENSIDERSTTTFVVYDSLGTAHYTRGQPVVISDTTLGVLFTGTIMDSTETRLIPNTAIKSAITCTDQRYFSDNRLFTGNEYVTRYAGDIVADLVNTYLVADGITANIAVDHDATQASFATGTLVNTTATPVDLELTASGTTFTKTETSTADFNTGTLTNVVGANNTLRLTSAQVMKFVGTASVNVSTDPFVYVTISNTALTLNGGDFLIYDLFVSSTSPAIACAIDILFTDGSNLRHLSMPDLNGLDVKPLTDLSLYAKDQWYHRVVPMTNSNTDLSGRTIAQVNVGFEGNTGGTSTAYIRNVSIQSSSFVVRQTYFNGSLSVNRIVALQAYFNVQLSVVTAYADTGQRVSPAYSMSSPGIVRNSLISWTSPAYVQNTSNANTYAPPVLVETSYDAGATWQVCTAFAALPNLLAGMSTSGHTITFRQTLSLAGPSPEMTPMLADCTVSIAPSYTATKSDAIDSDVTSGDFATGTRTNVVFTTGVGEQINGVYRSWDDTDFSNQTTYALAGCNPAVGISNGLMSLRCGYASGSSWINERLDFVGNGWNDFVLEVDIMSGDLVTAIYPGILFRTSGWQNVDATYAYNMQFEPTRITWRKGTNTSSGGGVDTVLYTSATYTLTANTFYHLKLVALGSSVKCYINDVLYINGTDGTYTGGGYIGLRLFNGVVPRNSAYFDNFGIQSAAFTGNRVHSALALNALGSVENSIIQWNATTPGNTTLLVESSINGGSTWAACTNNAVIPQLTPGVSTVGVSLLVRETMTTQNANSSPALTGISAVVIGNYSATGTRVSPVLPLGAVLRCGSTSVTWNALTPPNTSLTVQSSPDAVTWTTIATNGGTISSYPGQADPTIDTFTTNTSANYTTTFASGGVTATWTYDLVNLRITATGGTKAQYVSTLLSGTDGSLVLDMDESDKGGLLFHYTNNLNYYYVVVHDASSATLPNTLQLFRVAAGVATQLGTTQTIAFVRGTYHRISMSYVAALITVLFDGVSLISTTDGSPLLTGSFGFWNDGGTSRYYQLWAQLLGTVLTGKNVYSKLILSSTDPSSTPAVLELTTSVRSQDIDNGALISLTSYKYQNTISSTIDDLASASNCWWGIMGGRVQFQNRTAHLSPFLLQSPDLLAGHSLALKNTSPYYRNRQWVIGGTDKTALTTDSRVGNGFITVWSLAYPVYAVTPATAAPVVTRNGIVVAMGVSGVDTGKDFYYQVGSNTIAQDPTAIPLDSSETLTIAYYGEIPVVVSANNVAQQTALAAIQGGSGIVEEIETVSGIDFATATTVANARLTQYALLAHQFNFATARSGLAPGQLLAVFVPEHGIFDGQYLITKVKILPFLKGDGTVYYQYEVESTDGPGLGSWTKFFVALGQTIPT